MDRREGHHGRRTALLIAAIATAMLVASPVGATAAELGFDAERSKTVKVGPADPVASAAKKKKKKKKKKPVFSTASSQVGLLSGTAVVTNATCPGTTHRTGGGYAAAPNYAQPNGLRTAVVNSAPVDAKTWTAGASAFSIPSAAGAFTTYARCESDSLGLLAITSSSTLTLPPATVQNMTFSCPTGTHVLSGGFSGTGPVSLANHVTGSRIFILQSRRTGVGQWTVTGANNPNANSDAQLTGYATCERDLPGLAITEVPSTLIAVGNDTRSAADATCTGKTHSVGGGFLLTPNGVGAALFATVDENAPVGEQGWHVGLYEHPTFPLPPSASLTGYAYCKPDTLAPKKKKKKKKK